MKKNALFLCRSLCIIAFFTGFFLFLTALFFRSNNPKVPVLLLEENVKIETISSSRTKTFGDLIFWKATSTSSEYKLTAKASFMDSSSLRKLFVWLGSFFRAIPLDSVECLQIDSENRKLRIQANGIPLPEIDFNPKKFDQIFGSIGYLKKVNENTYVNHTNAILNEDCTGVYVGDDFFDFGSCYKLDWCN